MTATRTAARVLTFGCRLNSYESAAIRQTLNEVKEADRPLIVINTCAVTREAERQARQAIRRQRRAEPEAVIAVTGCAAQIDPRSYAGMEDVDLVIGNAEKFCPSSYAPLPDGDKEDAERKLRLGEAAAQNYPPSVPPRQVRAFDGRSRALVPIQNGCDHRCTYCIIPFGRGASRSTPPDRIIAQLRALVEQGYQEAVLTGVDLTDYGRGLPDGWTLGRLVRRILRAVPDIRRLRLSSLDAAEFDHDLLEAFAEEERLMPHVHLSLQSGDDLILKRMKRRHSRQDVIALCERLRRLRPDVVFGADMIAGFPTETEAMFGRSMDIVDACGLVWLHVFPFSPRPGTPASRMPQTPHSVITERARQLRERGKNAEKLFMNNQLGNQFEVLSEMPDQGRTPQFAPIYFDGGVEPGRIVSVIAQQILTPEGRGGLALYGKIAS